MIEKYKFPNSFLWGSSTAAYQVEGGIDNNDWAQAARDGRVPAAGRACDHYNRYEEDFDIAKSLGQNAHRFSIEWSRVEPEEGRFDENEIEHYRKVLAALQDRGLEPVVTLWHFTLPVWFAKMGGFENKKAPFYFARYCEHVVSQIGDRAKFWITINEPMVYVGFSYGSGVWPPFKKNFIKVWKVVDNLVMSHNIAYQKIKVISQAAQVGIAADQADYHYNDNPLSFCQAKFMNWFRNRRFINKIISKQDFIGLNFYLHKHFGYKFYEKKSDMGWPIYPPAIYHVLAELKKYNKPIYITENGIADATDTKRAKYIKEHLHWVWQAVHDGCDVRGYFYWSLLDNFEWVHGFDPRFGIVEMNYDTLERTIRPSAYEYKRICENNEI
ncbi:MAG: glycoside hydrolase family 1 protein [Patescibacteria group bacterium]